jgi:plasmid replication initiation protein
MLPTFLSSKVDSEIIKLSFAKLAKSFSNSNDTDIKTHFKNEMAKHNLFEFRNGTIRQRPDLDLNEDFLVMCPYDILSDNNGKSYYLGEFSKIWEVRLSQKQRLTENVLDFPTSLDNPNKNTSEYVKALKSIIKENKIISFVLLDMKPIGWGDYDFWQKELAKIS